MDSAVFAGSWLLRTDRLTDRQTVRPCYFISSSRPHLPSAANLQCSL